MFSFLFFSVAKLLFNIPEISKKRLPDIFEAQDEKWCTNTASFVWRYHISSPVRLYNTYSKPGVILFKNLYRLKLKMRLSTVQMFLKKLDISDLWILWQKFSISILYGMPAATFWSINNDQIRKCEESQIVQIWVDSSAWSQTYVRLMTGVKCSHHIVYFDKKFISNERQ